MLSARAGEDASGESSVEVRATFSLTACPSSGAADGAGDCATLLLTARQGGG